MTGGDTLRPGAARWAVPAAALALWLGCTAAFSSIGAPAAQPPLAGLAAVLALALRAGAPAAAYLLAGIGWGEVFARVLRGSRDAALLRAALGVGLMLSLSHGLGCLGLFAGGAGRAIAVGIVGAGLVLLAIRAVRARVSARTLRVPVLSLVLIPALALMTVAASSPPGWLWGSEAGGYDVLEYHLELPQEWLRLGRVWPLGHNVYSYLPGYVESAFYHLAAMTGAGPAPAPGARAWGLLADDGWRLLSCQFLSVWIAVLAAAAVGRLAVSVRRRASGDGSEAAARTAGLAAAVLFLCTPWTIVVGSMAYNDLAVVGLLAAAMAAAHDDGLRPGLRGAIAGALVGFACCCKPTAILLGGAPVALLLLAAAPRRQWPVIAAAGAAAGLLVIAPWLTRNWLASGNPVFPFGAGLFGADGWTAEQVQRYVAGHSFHGSLAERLRLLVLPDPNDPAGPVHRGLLHPQWFLLFPACIAAAAVGIARRSTRRPAALLGAAMFAQLAVWLFLTHVQSRFLLPLAAPGCALFGLALVGTPGKSREPPATLPSARGIAARAIAGVLCLAQLAWAVRIFSSERAGAPNAMLLAGPGVRTGEGFAPQDRAALLESAGPTLYINLTTPPGRRVYLLGDATPLYYTADVLYNTTYDRWSFGDAVRAAPGDPAAWTRELRRRGISRVLVSSAELDRLTRSGWIDPAVTPQAVGAWLKSGVRVVRQWPGGWALVELAEAAG
jgi:hypothetical protein